MISFYLLCFLNVQPEQVSRETGTSDVNDVTTKQNTREESRRATMNAGRLGFSAPLDEFPELKILTSSSFAHDFGTQHQIESVSCAGKEVKITDLLAALVTARGGWTQDGASDSESVKKISLAFALTLCKFLETDVLTDEAAPSDLTHCLGGSRSAAPRRDLPAQFPSYHPAKADIYQVKDDKDGVSSERSIVVVSYYERGHISQRGRHWTYHVQAYDAKTGETIVIPKKARGRLAANEELKYPDLPRPQYFSEAGF